MSEQKSWSVGWHDRGHGHGDYGVIDGEEKLIAKVVSGLHEDAAMLAAAHELFAVAERVVDWMNANGYADNDQSFGARAAIAKAKGIEP